MTLQEAITAYRLLVLFRAPTAALHRWLSPDWTSSGYHGPRSGVKGALFPNANFILAVH
jgi:hypothetical protein